MEPEQVRDALRLRYADVAEQAGGQFKYPVGRESSSRRGRACRPIVADRVSARRRPCGPKLASRS
jgi:hypothetical protein